MNQPASLNQRKGGRSTRRWRRSPSSQSPKSVLLVRLTIISILISLRSSICSPSTSIGLPTLACGLSALSTHPPSSSSAPSSYIASLVTPALLASPPTFYSFQPIILLARHLPVFKTSSWLLGTVEVRNHASGLGP
jgi:hypothetical protein